MPKVTLTNMVMIQDAITKRVLVQDRVLKYKGIAFPGGKAMDGESIHDSSVREIKEETGYDIKNLQPCGFIYWDEGNGEKYFTFFYKTSDYAGESIGETREGKVFWCDLADLNDMKLAPNMDKYLPMFLEGKYSECYCLLNDKNEWDVVYA